MRIALINPKYPDHYNDKRIEGLVLKLMGPKKKFTPKLTIIALFGMLCDISDVDIIDENCQNIDYSVNYDLVGITSMTYQAYRAYEISKEFRKRGVPVIIGGVHPTLMPEEVSHNADSIFIGEAEGSLQEVVNDLKKDKLKPVYYGKSKGLSDLIPIRYDIFKKLLEKGVEVSGYETVIPMQITRGCHHKCSFCTVNKLCGSKFRKKEMKTVISEIDEIGRNFSFDNIIVYFQDDNFSTDKKFTSDLMDRLREYKLHFRCLTDISLGDDMPLLKKMHEAGCERIGCGLETVNENSIKEVGVHKATYHHRYTELLTNIRNCGISTSASFVFGWDNDVVNVFAKTIDFIFDNDIILPVFLACTPLPKTDIEEKFIEEGRILEKDYWDKCNGLNVLYKPKQMTKKELEDNLYQIYLDVYRWVLPLEELK